MPCLRFLNHALQELQHVPKLWATKLILIQSRRMTEITLIIPSNLTPYFPASLTSIYPGNLISPIRQLTFCHLIISARRFNKFKRPSFTGYNNVFTHFPSAELDFPSIITAYFSGISFNLPMNGFIFISNRRFYLIEHPIFLII